MTFQERLKTSVKRFSPINSKGIFLFVLAFLAMVCIFALLPLPGGDDWETFQGASLRLLEGVSLYGERITHAYYSNPPWVAVLLLPFGLLPFRWGWAIISVSSFVFLVLLSRRWRLDIWRTVLVLASPATFYIVLHGQIDAWVLAGILLPQEFWPLIALSKPQVTIGLLFGLEPKRAGRALIISVSVLILSLILFGLWPIELLRQPRPFVMAQHNLWAGLWPFQLPAGIAMLLLGIRRKNEGFLVAASPLLSPYAATSSLIGPWLVLSSYLRTWEALMVFLFWWGAVVYRLLG
jgi:hypothetical protein